MDEEDYILGDDNSDIAEIAPGDMSGEIDEIKAEMTADRDNTRVSINEIRQKLSDLIVEMTFSKKDREDQQGTDHHVEMDEDAEMAAGGDDATRTFTVTVSGSTASISYGLLQIGTTTYEVPSGTVALSSSTEYVYVYHMKDHSSSGFGHSSSIPDSSGNQWRFILVKLAGNGTTWNEVWVGHQGNVIMSAPTA